MRPFYIILFWLLFFTKAGAQNIKVLSMETKNPIPGVAIYNVDKSKSVITNFRGEATLEIFLDSEIIYFKHLAHSLKKGAKKEFITSNVIYLNSNTNGLEEIVISASRFKQKKRDLASKIVSIDAKSIQFTNPQTSADLLESTGHVFVQKSQMGGGSPMIRGFSTNRLLITVDGVRLNNAIFRGGNLHNVISIDPFALQNVEITLGSGSIIYGSDAIGGVMSFYSKKPKLSYNDSLHFKANSVIRYSSANSENTAHLDLNFGFNKWGFLTSLSYSSFDDLTMGRHGPKDYLRGAFALQTKTGDVVIENNNPRIQKFTGYNQFNFAQKAHYKAQKDLSLDFGLFYTTTSDIPRYDRLIRFEKDGLPRYAEWDYGPQRWLMSNVQATKLSSKSVFYNKIKATFAYQYFEESRNDRRFLSSFRNVKQEAVNAYTFNLDLEKRLTSKMRLFYGSEFIYNKVLSKARIENISNNTFNKSVSRYPNGSSWQSAAVYSNLKYKPNPQFVYQMGLRFNRVVSKANFEENNVFLNLPFDYTKNQTQELTGSSGVSWTPNKTVQWRLNLSTAFRAPNIDDIGKVFDSEPGSVVIPNERLKPEYAYGGELGLKLNFNNKLVLDMSTYYTYLDNALVRSDFNLNGNTQIMYDGVLSNVQAIQNASKANIYGFEFGLKMPIINHIDLISQYALIAGKEETGGLESPTRHVAPSFGNTHLIWSLDDLKLDLFANYNGELSFNQLAFSEREKQFIYALDANNNPYSPSWYTLNFRVQYSLNKNMLLTASFENLSDQRYKTYSSGIASPGRNIILSLKYGL